MVIDKGLAPGAFADLLRVAAPYVQLWKLGFGTAVLYPPELVARKVSQARLVGVEVYPGGTCLELARVAGQTSRMLRRFADLGFRWVEISDGTFDMTPRERRALIRQSVELGFEVVSEVGSKDERRTFEPGRAVEQAAADLAAGARYVIVEARDSGRGVGIFDDSGQLKAELLEQLEHGLEAVLPGGQALGSVIWEAPLTEQQRWLLLRFGPAVGLGNVQVGDVLTLAAMRLGLRSDTLRAWSAAPGRQTDPAGRPQVACSVDGPSGSR